MPDLLGSLCAIAAGTAIPLMTVIFSNIINARGLYAATLAYGTVTPELTDDVRQTVYTNIYYFIAIGGAIFIVGFLQMFCWLYTGERQTSRIRILFFRKILQQQVEFFDRVPTGDVTTRLIADTDTIQEGISDKVGVGIQQMTTFFAGFIIAFVRGWKMALVLLSIMPVLAACSGLMAYGINKSSQASADAYASAGGIAQEALSGVKTVVAFGRQQRAVDRYVERLLIAQRAGVRKAFGNGFGIATVMFILYSAYALGFWYGGQLIIAGQMNGGEVLNVFLAVLIGAFSLGNVSNS